MSDLGEREPGAVLVFQFTSSVNGVPTTLSGSPVISVYKDSTTESTTGVTLTADYDARTGLNHVKVDTTADTTFYAAENDYSVVVTTGTVGGVSVVGFVVGSFSLTNERATLDKTVNAMPRGTVTSGSTTTSVTTSAFAINGAAATGVVSNQYSGRVVLFDGGTTTAGLRGSVATITASSASNTPTLTVTTLPATPASGDTFSVI